MLIRWDSMRGVSQNTFIAFTDEFDDKNVRRHSIIKIIFHY
jgi:hypothetical protein